MAETARISKIGVLAEFNSGSPSLVAVTREFLLVELTSSLLTVGQASILVEYPGNSIAVMSQMFYLIEVIPTYPYPVLVKNNLRVSFNGTAVESFIQSFGFGSATKIVDITNVASTDVEKLGTSVDWTLTFSGYWAKVLDDVFGAAISSEQNKVTCIVQLGQGFASVFYQWTLQAFVASYRVDPKLQDVLMYDVTISLSGAPSRSS